MHEKQPGKGMEEIFLAPFTNKTPPHWQQVAEPLPWICTQKGHPYFFTETGESWTPIGQNDAITWPDLQGLFRRKDKAGVERYLAMLAQQGVTCLRLMLEYCQVEHRYFEKPAGHFPPNMIQLWDDLFQLCEQYRLRILLTPFDTFWMWRRWRFHPYRHTNGGPCSNRSHWLLCAKTRAAIKQRLLFATERWGGSGALFAWDLWNEIHPAHSANAADVFDEFVADIGGFLRQTEMRLYGKAHLQTVSVFGPVLFRHPQAVSCAYRHPALDFATIHLYEKKTIDRPKNTVDAAISTGRLTRSALSEIKDNRPFLDSEHGPIHTFKDCHITLPEPFDDEYFRHMQWAHFASGGAGGGMRWPYRHPHCLTAGMRTAQKALSNFLPLINWKQFRRRNWNAEVGISLKALAAFACGDEHQAVLWLLRRDDMDRKGMLQKAAEPVTGCVHLPFRKSGWYEAVAFNTVTGKPEQTFQLSHAAGAVFCLPLPPITTDLAIAVRRISD